ncbi:heat shock protein implicated in recycling of 50S subunit [Candidatus Gastranaerophilus sp. (ex Termes propinquus)]|nr:heat shock protein implicated in recycling of 50S subunit [Candidatus Gastranaerophilus sp. (ex Termes propinquus)]
MRLDKFLKVSRLIKRRTVAAEVCESARVFVNDSPAKPAKQLRVGDIIAIEYTNRTLRAKVLKVPEGNVSVNDAQGLYELMEGEE